ncbi:MAG: ATP-binding protein, partial [Planctomycetota bacterium]|nr:ATP-binding protein [Planctomycetota bacterium]
GELEITRASGRLRLPARTLLVGATNPCPCGYRGHATRECRCTPRQVARYVGRLSGPLLDRIDLHVDVPAIPLRELSGAPTGEGSAEMRILVMDARERQARRGSGRNGRLAPRQMAEVCRLDPTAEALLHSAAERFSFSARAYHQILRVARTIADLAARDSVGAEQIAEAIRYRSGGSGLDPSR